MNKQTKLKITIFCSNRDLIRLPYLVNVASHVFIFLQEAMKTKKIYKTYIFNFPLGTIITFTINN
jgi:hypothetical protein